MLKVAVIVLHYRGKQLTEKCLYSLTQAKTNNFLLQTIVIDNNSPESLTNLKGKFSKVNFLKNQQNLGYAGGNNTGLKYALSQGADYLLLLNNDTECEKNFLIHLLAVARADEKIGILAPKIYFAPGYEYHHGRYSTEEQGKVFWYAGGIIDWKNLLSSHRGVDEVDQGQYQEDEETDYASGCAMLIKKDVLEKVGLLDQRYFLYLEDLEFCQRAKQAGYKIVYVPKAVVWHYNAQSSQVGGGLHDYFIARNRLLFGMKYAPWKTKYNLFQEGLRILIKGRPWQKEGVKDYFLKRFGKGSWHEKN